MQQIALSSGLKLKTAQAFSIVNAKSQHTFEYHLVSYWFLDPVISFLKAVDPGNTYILDSAKHNSRDFMLPPHILSLILEVPSRIE